MSDPDAFRYAWLAGLPGRLPYEAILRNPAWALTREWALSIRVTKISTWALTQEWALARENTVDLTTLAEK